MHRDRQFFRGIRIPDGQRSRNVQGEQRRGRCRAVEAPRRQDVPVRQQAQSHRLGTDIARELRQVAVRVSQIECQVERRVLVFHQEVGAVHVVIRREIRAVLLVLLVVHPLARREPEQPQQRADDGRVHDGRLIAPALRRRTLQITRQTPAWESAFREDRKEGRQELRHRFGLTHAFMIQTPGPSVKPTACQKAPTPLTPVPMHIITVDK